MRPVARGLAALVALCALALAGACGGGPGTGAGTGPGTGATGAAAGGYAVTVRSGASVTRFDSARLAALPRSTVDTPASGGERMQSGPALAAVLAAAGVHGYRAVRVAGPDESVTLTAAEVGPDLLLADTRRGTVKLAGPGLDPSRWVRDVTDVEVTT